MHIKYYCYYYYYYSGNKIQRGKMRYSRSHKRNMNHDSNPGIFQTKGPPKIQKASFLTHKGLHILSILFHLRRFNYT